MKYTIYTGNKIEDIITEAQKVNLEKGEACYYSNKELIIDRDGCQPSNCCFIFSADSKNNWIEIKNALKYYLEYYKG